MITSDISAVLQWWFVILIIGIGFLPLSAKLFRRFFDKGYIFSKLAGIAISSYAVYLFGIIHLISFSQLNAVLVLIFSAAVLNYFVRGKFKIVKLLKENWRIMAAEEVLFLTALFVWSYVHSFSPDIHGLEKYMDYGFLNSILRSDYFPPKDMWFPPDPINYYYYGHFITAFLTKLSGVQPYLSFNIMLSTVFAFCLAETFSIGANLFYIAQKKIVEKKFVIKTAAAGLLTALLTTLAGNLHILYSLFTAYKVDEPKPIWELAFSPMTFPNAYWYPNATRYIFHTIHEFPIYSWVVADLHGHVLDIPFVLLMIAILFAIFVNSDPDFIDEKKTVKKEARSFFAKIQEFAGNLFLHPGYIVLIGFMLGIMYMTNAWDGAIYLLLVSLVIFYLLWERFPSLSKDEKVLKKRLAVIYNFVGIFSARLLMPIFLIAGVFFITTFPYNFYFKPFASGIGILCAPDALSKIGKFGPFLFEPNHCQHSYWWELLILYGFFYFFVFSFLIFLGRAKKILRVDMFVLLLIILSTLLIFIPEFIYVKDIYPEHYRANTMFKLVFQAFIMLSLVSVYVITRLAHSRIRFVFLFFSLILVGAVMTYPYLAIGSYYGDLKNYKGLDGIVYLKTLYPDDFEGINWLNKNVKGQPVILEAQGDSYTDFARVSANTGLPTVLGWTVHEWLWRGDYGIPAPRITDVTTLYETSDQAAAKKLLKKYEVRYVFLGALEYQKYPKLNEEKFENLGELVFQKGKTKIFEIPQ